MPVGERDAQRTREDGLVTDAGAPDKDDVGRADRGLVIRLPRTRVRSAEREEIPWQQHLPGNELPLAAAVHLRMVC